MSAYPGDLASVVCKRLASDEGESIDLPGLEMVLDAAFQSSLQTDEQRPTRYTIALFASRTPEPSSPVYGRHWEWTVVPLEPELAVTPRHLTQLSQVAVSDGALLAADATIETPTIWGLVDQAVHYATFIRGGRSLAPRPPGVIQVSVDGPGRISVSRNYGLLVALDGGKLTESRSKPLHTRPLQDIVSPWISRAVSNVEAKFFGSDLGRELDDRWPNWRQSIADRWVGVLARVLMRIGSFRHGGSLLLSADGSRDDLMVRVGLRYDRLGTSFEEWCHADFKRRIVGGRFDRRLNKMGSSLRDEEVFLATHLRDQHEAHREEVDGCIDFVAGLARMDGAVLMEDGFLVRGAGVELTANTAGRLPVRALDDGARERERFPLDNLGTRHRSMIRYCAVHPGSLGLVVSQDGAVRAISVEGEDVVVWSNIDLPLDVQPEPEGSRPGRLVAR